MDTEHYNVFSLFDGLVPEESARLDAIAIAVVAAPGDVLVREGESGNGFFTIESGGFEVQKAGTSIARLEHGSCFGEMSLVSQDPRVASVVCVEAGALKKFPARRFEELLAHDDLAALKVVRNMCRMLATRLSRLENDVYHRPLTLGGGRRKTPESR